MTEGYLDSLWSQAIRARKGEFCCNPGCPNPAGGVHHIIKRRYKVLRWDARNGIPLCSICHPIADRNSAWALSLISAADRKYLEQMGVYVLQDWLKINGLTRDEFMQQKADECKAIIKARLA